MHDLEAASAAGKPPEAASPDPKAQDAPPDLRVERPGPKRPRVDPAASGVAECAARVASRTVFATAVAEPFER